SSVVEVPPGFRTAYEIAQETGLVSRPTPTPTASTARSVPWRRGDYFFCESCGQRKQWFRNPAPWRGATCAPCSNGAPVRSAARNWRRVGDIGRRDIQCCTLRERMSRSAWPTNGRNARMVCRIHEVVLRTTDAGGKYYECRKCGLDFLLVKNVDQLLHSASP